MKLSKLWVFPMLSVGLGVLSPGSPARAGELNWQVVTDSYYAFDLQQPADQTRQFTTQALRHNDFSLNLGLLDISYQDQNIRGRLAGQTGTYVESNLAAEPALFQPIFAAHGGVRLWDNIWLDGGIFPSHIGFESAISMDNWNYTRSLVAEFSPYYESGLKLSGSWEQLDAALLVLNGWQNIRETNSHKALGTQVTWQPMEHLALNWSTFLGNEAPDAEAFQLRFFNHLYAHYTFWPGWEIAGVLDSGWQGRPSGGAAHWWGAALLSRYELGQGWALGGRVEYYADPEQVIVPTGTERGFQVASTSLNLDYAFTDWALWRIEGRVSQSRDAIYPGPDAERLSALNAMVVTSLSLRFGGQHRLQQEVQGHDGI